MVRKDQVDVQICSLLQATTISLKFRLIGVLKYNDVIILGTLDDREMMDSLVEKHQNGA